MKTNILWYLFLLIGYTSQAQKVTVPMQASHWIIKAKESKLTTYLGKPSIYLKNGSATAKNVDLKNGIIEFDIAFSQKRQFSGVHFRLQPDLINSEEFYLRPHQSGNPDANQYTPIVNGLAGWQIYYGKGHSKAYQYKFDQWMHVKIIFADNEAEFYIDDMTQPLFRAYELKHSPKSGGVAFSSSLQGAYFANFSYQKLAQPTLKGKVLERKSLAKGTITQWQVSSIFPESSLENQYRLSASMKSSLQWKSLSTEFTGIANLARVNKINAKQKLNTAFAKVVIESDQVQIKKLDLGYSDRVYVYCNDQLMYSGSNRFRSRDYRYLGTIGYFDTVYLPLKKGKNEVWIAVSENFGGWGIQAKLSNMTGIKVQSSK
ncbi:hypothetical protein BKI52_14665 [marine bacterium AO1-C]|nr:hypothetical protein BKI52_14665 [marine bacterium AO1-C]